jgi:hypothetical protein
MANEFKHAVVGTDLTKDEWEAIDAHVFDGQAAGDMLYAISATQLARLPKGTDGKVLVMLSGVPAWVSLSALDYSGLPIIDPETAGRPYIDENGKVTISAGGGTNTYQMIAATGPILLGAGNFYDYTPPGGVLVNAVWMGAEGTVSRQAMKIYTDCALSDLAVYIPVNTMGQDIFVKTKRIRAGVTTELDMMVTIPDGETGVFVDSTNTENFLAGDYVVFNWYWATGTGEATMTWLTVKCVSTKVVWLAGTNFTSGSTFYATTVYLPIGGDFSTNIAESATEANAQWTVRTPTTLTNLRVKMVSNTRDADVTITLRKNGADTGLTVTIPANSGETEVEDTNGDHAVSVEAGDKICYEVVDTGGTTGSFNIVHFQMESSSATKPCIIAKLNKVPSGTQYFYPEGELVAVDQTTAEVKILGDFTAKNLQVNCSVNSGGETEQIIVQKNGVDTALLISIPANTTGIFENTADEVVFADGDTINYKVIGYSPIKIGIIGLELAPVV